MPNNKSSFSPIRMPTKRPVSGKDINRVQDEISAAMKSLAGKTGSGVKITSRDGSIGITPKNGVGPVVDLSAETLVNIVNSGSKIVDIGSTGPSDLLDVEPAFWARITIGGKPYMFPLWRETTGGVIPLSGLVAWFKSDTGITLSGSDVTAWADASGNGFDLVNSGTVTFNASDINSLPSINTGSSVAMIRSANLLGSGHDRTVFAVARQATSVGYAVCSFGDGTANGFGCNYESLGGSQRYVWTQNIGGGYDAYFTKVGDESSVAHYHQWRLSGTTLAYALDGTDVGALTYDGSFVSDAASALFTVGGLAIAVGTRPWTGSIAEVIVYDRALNTTEIAQVNAYLSSRYSL